MKLWTAGGAAGGKVKSNLKYLHQISQRSVQELRCFSPGLSCGALDRHCHQENFVTTYCLFTRFSCRYLTAIFFEALSQWALCKISSLLHLADAARPGGRTGQDRKGRSPPHTHIKHTFEMPRDSAGGSILPPADFSLMPQCSPRRHAWLPAFSVFPAECIWF